MYVLIALAIFDYFWSKFQWLNRNYRMTKDEVKDERKAMEGDETTKRRIIAKGLQRIGSASCKSVPQADVVVTNPTHFAVALKYDRGNDGTRRWWWPRGAAFWRCASARLPKRPVFRCWSARASGARALSFRGSRSEIPYELFKAVAEVLAYVYKLRTARMGSCEHRAASYGNRCSVKIKAPNRDRSMSRSLVIALSSILMLPMPTAVLDVCIAFNITISLVMLFVVLCSWRSCMISPPFRRCCW